MTEKALDEILLDFDRLDRAVIDSSSIIYMGKAGFLVEAGRALTLLTVPGVLRETGSADLLSGLPLTLLEDAGTGPIDHRVVRAALDRGLPLISDDRKMLLYMGGKDASYYNALMVLLLLVYRGSFGWTRYESCLSRLVQVSHYKRRITDFGAELAVHIAKRA